MSSFGTVTATTVLSCGFAQFDNASTTTNTLLLVVGTIDATSVRYAAGGTATVNAADLLTVVEGGHSYTLQLAGSYTGDTFELAEDAASGTLITLSAATAASAGAAIAGELLPRATMTLSTPAAPDISAPAARFDPAAERADADPAAA